jgi:hypothetical protein
MGRNGSEIIKSWPEQSRGAAQLVIDKYGEPHEATESLLTRHSVGPWKRMVASKEFFEHDFPAPHVDCVESVLEYRVPTEFFTALAEFDGSVICERTAGEVSARCHDEDANNLALNLMHDIVTGAKDVEAARQYYTKEFADYRRRKPTPYMNELRIQSASDDSRDPDERMLSDEDLEQAVQEGKQAERAAV